MTEPNLDRTTAAGFLSERRNCLYIYPVQSEGGEGWDIVMRIDGTYFGSNTKADADELAKSWQELFDDIQDVPQDRRYWWAGPPWKAAPR